MPKSKHRTKARKARQQAAFESFKKKFPGTIAEGVQFAHGTPEAKQAVIEGFKKGWRR